MTITRQPRQASRQRALETRRPIRPMQLAGGLAALLGGGFALLTEDSFARRLPLSPQLETLAESSTAAQLPPMLLLVAALLLAVALGTRAGSKGAVLAGMTLLIVHGLSWLDAAQQQPIVDAALGLYLWPGIGFAAACVIAASWPVQGFDRWSWFLVAGGQLLTLAAGTADIAALADAMRIALPLGLLLAGLGHTVSGIFGTRMQTP
ncbi:hypothetical protein [Agrococcus sp. ARC_14]|uniref:hypothetical protein n=1 Tax=Agrococcus sp. ARC_14 TaxID=2919927 RepID=UPI001F067A53|nr:hypothetical protein [Agrococcus sp. ARC_14]MCH1882205.1 hypothetical protein [Agrococcus sp. ARC_14]